MSGRRTKQLREECARRLGRASLKADGHVTHRAVTVLDNSSGRSILRRAMAVLKPKPIQIDEFRFFKRRRRTPAEERAARKEFLASRASHEAAVERNNERLMEIAHERLLAREAALQC